MRGYLRLVFRGGWLIRTYLTGLLCKKRLLDTVASLIHINTPTTSLPPPPSPSLYSADTNMELNNDNLGLCISLSFGLYLIRVINDNINDDP
jgi:hypothetical protein